MKITIVSDIHINSFFTKEKKFLELMDTLETDLLVINGDLYDLYLGPPKKDVIKDIKKNKNIKDIVYIRGNHDFRIKDHFTGIKIYDFYEIGDLYITHGHQYDFLSKEEPRKYGYGVWTVKIRDWIERVFKFNVRIFLKKLSFGSIDKLLFRAQKLAVLDKPNKKIILGHTHLPINDPPYYNCGCMVDDFFTYMDIDIENGVSNINLISDQ